MLDQIADFISSRERFAIVSHARPDGDSLGSTLGLGLALQSLGKTVSMLCSDPAPHPYQSLPGVTRLEVLSSLRGSWDGVIVLECNRLARTGVSGLERYPVVNIDHHLDGSTSGRLNWVDPKAAAVAEMVFLLIERLQAGLTPPIAVNLYTAILTDTGSFRFSSTSAETFRICAALVRAGANPGRVAEQIYFNHPPSRLRLLALVLKTLQIDPSGRIAWMDLTPQMLEKAGAVPADSEEMVTHALSLQGVRAVAFFRRQGNRSYRISLRSKGNLDVSSIARRFGGGGHRNAAGLTLPGSGAEVHRRVISELEQMFGEASQS